MVVGRAAGLLRVSARISEACRGRGNDSASFACNTTSRKSATRKHLPKVKRSGRRGFAEGREGDRGARAVAGGDAGPPSRVIGGDAGPPSRVIGDDPGPPSRVIGEDAGPPSRVSGEDAGPCRVVYATCGWVLASIVRFKFLQRTVRLTLCNQQSECAEGHILIRSQR
jgi:hypothetical protein